jgi:three-Cys-motif partner protein
LEELRVYCQTIKERNLKVDLFFNEFKPDKYLKLNAIVKKFLSECRKSEFCPFSNSLECPFIFKTENKDFKVLFNELYYEMNRTSQIPRFMFLDQNGIKFIDHDIFSKLISLGRTDFLFFISSSFAKRFAEVPEFMEYLKVSRQEFESSKPYDCHRVILKYYKNLIPSSKEYYLAPFSIRKPNSGNIYGLVFGSNSLRGLEKFLDTAWSLDEHTGEANYDIDDDKIRTGQLSVFPEGNVVKKLVLFKESLCEFLSDQPKSNCEVYQFTLESGFTPSHAHEILVEFQNALHLKVQMKDGDEKVRKSSFYLKYHPEKVILIRYE